MHEDRGTLWRLACPLPTMWRSDDTLQLGLEPPAGLLVANPPPALPDVLEALIRPVRRSELAELAGPGSQGWLDPLLKALVAAGLVSDCPSAPSPVTVIGQGRLAVLIAELLLAEVSGAVRLICPGSPGVPRAATALQARFPDRLLCVGHWSYSSADPAGIVIVATQAIEAERSLLTQLEADSQAYLVITACDAVASVGPLVVPGRTACQRCEDLHRCARDPAWPRLLAQLCRRRAGAGQAALHWAAATGAGHASAWLRGLLPDSLGATLELSGGHRAELRPLRPHAGCGCLQFG